MALRAWAALACAVLLSPAGPARAVTVAQGARPAEATADAVWAVRSGLNVAALQCQFSPFLRSVENYNAFLEHHRTELQGAHRALSAYFSRTAGQRAGMQRFDQHVTRVYQGFSAFEAQRHFCDVASRLVREALHLPKGQLTDFAVAHAQDFKGSTSPDFGLQALVRLAAFQQPHPASPRLTDPCIDSRGRPIRRCP